MSTARQAHPVGILTVVETDAGGLKRVSASAKDAAAVCQELGIDRALPVVVLIGGASALDKTQRDGLDLATAKERSKQRRRIETVMAGGLRPAISSTGAIVLTGGTDAGVMRMAGELLADSAAALVGVAPASMVDGNEPAAQLERHHHAVVLADGTRWGSETELLFTLAETITAGVAPGLVLLANGGDVSYEEATRFLRGGWPVSTVRGSGGAADDLIKAAPPMTDGQPLPVFHHATTTDPSDF